MPTSDIVMSDEGRPPMALQDVLSSRLVARSRQPAAATKSVFSVMKLPLVYKTNIVSVLWPSPFTPCLDSEDSARRMDAPT